MTRTEAPLPSRPWMLLMALAAATCFTGDGLRGLPCRADADCNPFGDLAGERLACRHDVCGYLPRCGDGIVDVDAEACDDGLDNLEVDHADGPGRCSAHDCTWLPFCGDGHTDDPFEDCDDGNDVDDDDCPGTCATPRCGDGFLQVGVERCDDGDRDNLDACVDTCVPAACGDGYTRIGVEQCDDGNLAGGDGCSPTCKHERCGDGTRLPTEECDDGNRADGDGCSALCALERCGDEVVQPPEECDDGNAVHTDACVNCRVAVCGDAVTRDDVEECDDANGDDTDTCTSACKAATCGDGFVHADVEACDDGDANGDGQACKADCTLNNVCGDGDRGPGEACDDGNDDEDDACLATCELNVCGDGVLDTTEEECDDADADDNDGCANDCRKGATALWAGTSAYHTCALREGKLRCWGYNFAGQLGVGSTANVGDEKTDLPPVDTDPGGVARKVVTAASHTCALLADDDSVRCWGQGLLLGRGNGDVDSVGDDPGEALPDPVVLGGPAEDIVAGFGHTCALLKDPAGSVVCWGFSPATGHPSYPVVGVAETPASVGPVPVGGKVRQITAGADHTCALFEDDFAGKVRCWGSNNYGQLGLGNHESIGDDEDPAEAPFLVLDEPGDPVAYVEAGYNHTCALLESGKVFCWGVGYDGRLGNWAAEDVGDDEHPNPAGAVKVLDPGDDVIGLAPGGYGTCARLSGGEVRCWGYLGPNQLIGDTPGEKAPLVDLGGPVLALAAGDVHTCALLNGGRVRCWGDNGFGMLGLGHTDKVGPDDVSQDVFLYTAPN